MPKPAWTSYRDFALKIERTETGNYRVEAQGPSGEAESTFILPFDEKDITILLLQVGQPRSTNARGRVPEQVQPTVNFGEKLFNAVLNGQVRDLFITSLRSTQQEEAGLRIRLRLIGVPELADLPWEFLYDGREFLALSHDYSLVRYLDLPDTPRSLKVELPLRILATVSAPSDLPPLEVEREQNLIRESLAKLINAGKIELEFSPDATLKGLQRALRHAKSIGRPYHAWHFIGHATFDPASQSSALEMCDEIGHSFQVGAMQLATLFESYPEVRLVLLNACEGGRSGRSDPFGGVAAALVECGIPAVVGMQFEISDEAAISFAEEFYSALVDGLPLDAALTEARRAIFFLPNWVEWATPLLYMRSPSGVLFDVQAAPEQPAPPVETPPVKLPQPEPTTTAPAQSPAPSAEKAPVPGPAQAPFAKLTRMPAQQTGTGQTSQRITPVPGLPHVHGTGAATPGTTSQSDTGSAIRIQKDVGVSTGSLTLPVLIGGGVILLVALCVGLYFLFRAIVVDGKPTVTPTLTQAVAAVSSPTDTQTTLTHTPSPPTHTPTVFIIIPPEVAEASDTPTSPPPTDTPSITPTPTIPPSLGGGGALIAFVSDQDGQREIYVMKKANWSKEKKDWSDPSRLTSYVYDKDLYPPPYEYPAWSPDGKSLVFTSKSITINLINANGSGFINLHRVDGTRYQVSDLSWSPVKDEEQILFTLYDIKEKSSEICLMDVNDRADVKDNVVRCFPGQNSINNQAVFSPNGKWIAFSSNRDGDFEVYKIGAEDFNESSLVQLTKNDDVPDIHPAWSADGQFVYYMLDTLPPGDRTAMYEPQRVNANTRQSEKLSGFKTSKSSFYFLSWSPDGQYVLYAWDEAGDRKILEIYLARADGTVLLQLTNNISLSVFPIWQP